MTRNNFYRLIFTLFIAALSPFTQANTEPAAKEGGSKALTAYQIMQKVVAIDTGDNVIQDIEMTTIDKLGNKDIKAARNFRKKIGDNKENNASIMFFTLPMNMKDTAYLTWDFEDSSKDRKWMYLPPLNKTKRIASKDKRQSFAKSDFSHADMAQRNIDNYSYKILAEESLNDEPVWVIESIPNNPEEITESGYTRSVHTIRQSDYMIMGTVNTLKKGNYEKRMEVHIVEVIDGILVAKEVSMKTFKTDKLMSTTTIKITDIKFNQKMADQQFTKRRLQQGLN